ncbi:VOC family protein [Caldimonas brevitalea]|uniref:Glyoxalase n=1 Tax=Caldimonas brevitalea TaxID=413882 RepID=A0A0G3BPB5_9BURK|nr:VOC family protein [Caldimonas brevitalea]AKJ28405.1 glyoxalase [Caldimonas brevitalea]
MSQAVKAIPDGYTSITPYLTIKGAADAIEFYKKAFGAVENMRMNMPGGLIAHAEISIGGSVVMLHDESPQWNALSPATIGDSGTTLMLYVDNVDAVVERAVAAGATLTMEVADQFYGDRSGSVKDPFGHKWHIATHVEDVPPDELERRAAQLFAQPA